MLLLWHDRAVCTLLVSSYTVLVISVIEKVKQSNSFKSLQELQTVKVQQEKTGYCNHQKNVFREAEITVGKIPHRSQGYALGQK